MSTEKSAAPVVASASPPASGPGPRPERYVGLDVHKHYLLAVGVTPDKAPVFGPQRVGLNEVEAWCTRTLTTRDAVVLEMTTNTWELYDELVPHVHSVTVVHPPHVGLITRAQVKTDKLAARTLAQLHAAGLLPGVWIPPAAVRDLRALVAQRAKFVRLRTQAKNRLHAVLHRYHLPPPDGALFAPEQQAWWLALPVSGAERARIAADWATLAFAQEQVDALEATLVTESARDERVPLLLQLPGFGVVTALTLLGAIGDITRFPSAAQLVGYAGLGAGAHISGQTHHTGRITKDGRRDMRNVLGEAAQTAANTHPHWQAELARLEPRLGRNKAIVAIARKLLVAVWHILTDQVADRFADAERVARKFLAYAYDLGAAQRPDGQRAAEYVRTQLDRLQLGADLDAIPRGQQAVPLPPSRLAATAADQTADG